MENEKEKIHEIHENLLQRWLTILGDVPAKYANPLINEMQTFVIKSRELKKPVEEVKEVEKEE